MCLFGSPFIIKVREHLVRFQAISLLLMPSPEVEAEIVLGGEALAAHLANDFLPCPLAHKIRCLRRLCSLCHGSLWYGSPADFCLQMSCLTICRWKPPHACMSRGLQEPHWSCSSYHTRFKGRGPYPWSPPPPHPNTWKHTYSPVPEAWALKCRNNFSSSCFKNPLVLLDGAKASVKIPKNIKDC